MIIYGTRTYGRVDEIEDVGAVETKFFHVFWMPLIPMGSMFVFDDGEGLDDGEKHIASVPFSFKSMFVAWARAFFALLGLGVISGIMMLVEGEEETTEALLVLAVATVAWVLFFVVGSFAKKCSPERRHELLAAAGINPGGGPQGWPQGAQQQQPYPQQQPQAWPQGAQQQQQPYPQQPPQGAQQQQPYPQQQPQAWPQGPPAPGEGGPQQS